MSPFDAQAAPSAAETIPSRSIADAELIRLIVRNLYSYFRDNGPDDWSPEIADPGLRERCRRLALNGTRPDDWTVLNEDGTVLILQCKAPFVQGARALVRKGIPHETLVTMRIEGAAYDSFVPKPLGTVARFGVSERDGRSVRFEPWKPMDSERRRSLGSPQPSES